MATPYIKVTPLNRISSAQFYISNMNELEIRKSADKCLSLFGFGDYLILHSGDGRIEAERCIAVASHTTDGVLYRKPI